MPSQSSTNLSKKDASKLFSKPFVLFMGPQRSGTSWIDRYLRTHPEICLPGEVKEVFFFDRHFGRGLDFYKSHFKENEKHNCVCEVSTTAFDHSDAPKRVYETFGDDVTLICPLRHPVRRSYSLYKHYYRYGLVSGSLQQACESEPQILSSSHYAYHLKKWMDVFPRENFHFFFQEELEENQHRYVSRICDAMGVSFKPVEHALAGRFNAATRGQLNIVAGFAQAVADILRGLRLYAVINFAKKIGLKRLIFGKEPPRSERAEMPEKDSIWLEEKLAPEVVALEELIGPVSSWRNREAK